MKKLATVIALVAALSPSVWAAAKTVTLSVPGMTCAAYPITVRKALTKVDGVSKAEVSYDQRQATVTYDDVRTSIEALTKVTTNAGYPSTLKQ